MRTRPDGCIEAWAAISVGLMLLVLVAVLVLSPRFGFAIAVGVIGLFVLIESILRGGVIGLLATWVRLLAVVAAAVILVNQWQLGIIIAAIAAGLFILRANVSELLDSTRTNDDDFADDRRTAKQRGAASLRGCSSS